MVFCHATQMSQIQMFEHRFGIMKCIVMFFLSFQILRRRIQEIACHDLLVLVSPNVALFPEDIPNVIASDRNCQARVIYAISAAWCKWKSWFH